MGVSRHLLTFVSALWSAVVVAAQFETVPYLGPQEPYFLGNGTVGAGGGVDGVWDFLIGPDYTSPNFIKSESIEVAVDGRFEPLRLEMHRVRKSGVFVGTVTTHGCAVTISDFSVQSAGWVGRTIRIVNKTSEVHTISVSARIEPMNARGFGTAIEPNGGIRIRADKTAFCFGGGNQELARFDPRLFLLASPAP